MALLNPSALNSKNATIGSVCSKCRSFFKICIWRCLKIMINIAYRNQPEVSQCDDCQNKSMMDLRYCVDYFKAMYVT